MCKVRKDRSEPEVGDVVRQRPTEQKFHRQVVDALGIALLVGLLRLHPALREHVANRARGRLELVARRGLGDGAPLDQNQVPFVERFIVTGERHRPAAILADQIGSRLPATETGIIAHFGDRGVIRIHDPWFYSWQVSVNLVQIEFAGLKIHRLEIEGCCFIDISS